MTILAETWTVTIAYEWQKEYGEEGKGSKFTFASLRGCKEWAQEQIARGEKDPRAKVLWYAIEGVNHIPCDESKPWGQTYQGGIYFDYKDLR